MKRITSLFLAAAMLLSAAGCSNTTGKGSDVQGHMGQASQINSSDAALKLLSDYALVETIYPERAPYPNEMEYLDQKTGDFNDESFRKVYDAWRADQRARREGTDYTDDHGYRQCYTLPGQT